MSARRFLNIRPGENFSTAELILIFCSAALILDLVALPTHLWFDSYLLRDPAAVLSIHHLLSQGYRVNINFGYQYGLLGLLLQELCLAISGPTDCSAVEVLSIIFSLAIASGLAVFASRMKIGQLGFYLFLVTMPFTLVHYRTAEGALLSLALAQQAAGRRDRALALTTAACLAKPVMAYVYGFLLIVLIVADLKRKRALGFAAVVRSLLPAFTVGIILLVLLGAVFGPGSLITTILPLRGAANYRALHFGFFSGAGRTFWYFPGAILAYYFVTPAAFWLIGSVWLVFSGSTALYDLTTSSTLTEEDRRNREIIVTCAGLHVAFVTLFYGSAASWIYYAYILVMGIGATASWVGDGTAPIRRRSRFCLEALLFIALMGTTWFFKDPYQRWSRAARSEETAGLWAFQDERIEWTQVLHIVERAKAATLLVPFSGGELLFPEFQKPVIAFLLPGESVPSEVARKAGQLSGADFIVKPTARALGGDPDFILNWWPQLKNALVGTKRIFRGEYFEVYERS